MQRAASPAAWRPNSAARCSTRIRTQKLRMLSRAEFEPNYSYAYGHSSTEMKIYTSTPVTLPTARADVLHDRARESAVELRQLLITLSTACLAVFFVTLTGRDAITLSLGQRIAARLALLCMGGSVFAGVMAAFSDARRNYNLARRIQSEEAKADELAAGFNRRHRGYYRLLNISNWTQRLSFLAGIVATIAYTMSLISK
jgi:hypothetical protein